MTPTGIKPWKKCVEPILAMAPPQMLRQLHGFIGMVHFYRALWKCRMPIMAPLTKLTKVEHRKFKQYWTTEQDNAFQSRESSYRSQCLITLLPYPNPNEPFDIETDASDYQLGAVIKQDGLPIAFFSRKLTEPQPKYTTIKEELLLIIKVLEEYCAMLWGCVIRLHTDHKNLESHINSSSFTMCTQLVPSC
jgi:hypothetical protein